MGQLQSWLENSISTIENNHNSSRDIIKIEQSSTSELTEELFLESWRKQTTKENVRPFSNE